MWAFDLALCPYQPPCSDKTYRQCVIIFRLSSTRRVVTQVIVVLNTSLPIVSLRNQLCCRVRSLSAAEHATSRCTPAKALCMGVRQVATVPSAARALSTWRGAPSRQTPKAWLPNGWSTRVTWAQSFDIDSWFTSEHRELCLRVVSVPTMKLFSCAVVQHRRRASERSER